MPQIAWPQGLAKLQFTTYYFKTPVCGKTDYDFIIPKRKLVLIMHSHLFAQSRDSNHIHIATLYKFNRLAMCINQISLMMAVIPNM